MSTQTGESQIISMTSVTKTYNSSSMAEKCSTSSIPGPVSASGVVAQKSEASTSTRSVAANLSNRAERNTRSTQKGNQKLRCDRVRKRANDAVALHNRFGALEDIDFAPSPSDPPHAFVAFRQEKKRGYLLSKNITPK